MALACCRVRSSNPCKHPRLRSLPRADTRLRVCLNANGIEIEVGGAARCGTAPARGGFGVGSRRARRSVGPAVLWSGRRDSNPRPPPWQGGPGTHEMRAVARNPCSGATRVSAPIGPCYSSCGTCAARQPRNSTLTAWPAFMNDCRIAESSVDGSTSRWCQPSTPGTVAGSPPSSSLLDLPTGERRRCSGLDLPGSGRDPHSSATCTPAR
jgi:hypothetical protein